MGGGETFLVVPKSCGDIGSNFGVPEIWSDQYPLMTSWKVSDEVGPLGKW